MGKNRKLYRVTSVEPLHGALEVRGDFRGAEDRTELLKDAMIRVWGKWKASEGKETMFLLRVSGSLCMGTGGSTQPSGLPELPVVL